MRVYVCPCMCVYAFVCFPTLSERVSAAPYMYLTATAGWMVETSMRNVQLIEKIRKNRELMVCLSECVRVCVCVVMIMKTKMTMIIIILVIS